MTFIYIFQSEQKVNFLEVAEVHTHFGLNLRESLHYAEKCPSKHITKSGFDK
jgi:hypothetical protein